MYANMYIFAYRHACMLAPAHLLGRIANIKSFLSFNQ